MRGLGVSDKYRLHWQDEPDISKTVVAVPFSDVVLSACNEDSGATGAELLENKLHAKLVRSLIVCGTLDSLRVYRTVFEP
jgi:hypothetical protein